MAALASLSGEVLALAVPLLLFLGAALYLAPPELAVGIERQLETDRAGPNENIAVELRVQDYTGALQEVHVAQPLPEGLALVESEKDCLVPLQPDTPAVLRYGVRGLRGYYVWPQVYLEACDPFGLICRRNHYEALNRLFVLPEAVTMSSMAIKVRRTRVYPGLIPAHKGGPGVEFYGLREYQTGDSWRWLNHRTNARQESALFVNEFELERAIDSGLILDVRAATNLVTGNRSLLEFGIQATSALAKALLDQGNRVGLFLYGGAIDWTFPGSGKMQYEKILRALARARIERSQVFSRLDHVPARLFPGRSLLILVSPLQSQDCPELLKLRARGYQVLVVSPDPVALEADLLEDQDELALALRLARLERRQLMAQLMRGGIRVCEWDTRLPFAEVVQQTFGQPAARALALPDTA